MALPLKIWDLQGPEVFFLETMMAGLAIRSQSPSLPTTEQRALRFGILICCFLQLRQVHIEGNSKITIQMLLQKATPLWTLRTIVQVFVQRSSAGLWFGQRFSVLRVKGLCTRRFQWRRRAQVCPMSYHRAGKPSLCKHCAQRWWIFYQVWFRPWWTWHLSGRKP